MFLHLRNGGVVDGGGHTADGWVNEPAAHVREGVGVGCTGWGWGGAVGRSEVARVVSDAAAENVVAIVVVIVVTVVVVLVTVCLEGCRCGSLAMGRGRDRCARSDSIGVNTIDGRPILRRCNRRGRSGL